MYTVPVVAISDFNESALIQNGDLLHAAGSLESLQPGFPRSTPLSDWNLSFNAGTESSYESSRLDRVFGVNVFSGISPQQLFSGMHSFDHSPAGQMEAHAPAQLVVIDPAVDNWQQLLEGLTTNSDLKTEILVLDSAQDGLSQITSAVTNGGQWSALHLISHGSAGEISLGNGQLGGDLSAEEISGISSWRSHLTEGADILIYGCNLASNAAGRQLIQSIDLLSGADVAASDDLTGSSELGGNWNLEVATGLIEHSGFSATLANTDWRGVLETINIDQAWLNAQNSVGGPYYLDQANDTYVLQTDVTTNGTAFAITAANVVFDLNGHTVTYDNTAAINVANHSFENGSGASASNWDFSAAGSGERFDGEFLDNTLYDGDYSLRFGIQNGDQHVRSSSNVTLSANTTYSLTSMLYFDGPGNTVANNPGAEMYVRLESTSGGATHEAVWNTTNWRGIQLTEKSFTTGNSTESYRIVAGVRHDANVANHFAIIDDIKIQKYRTYGVTASAHDWAKPYYPGLNQWGWGTNATIKNGTIVQGQGNATWSHGVFVHSTSGVTIDNLDVTVAGSNSSAVYGRDNNTNMSIGNSDFTSNVKTIKSRDNFNAAVLFGVSGEVFNNSIHNGVHAGIYVGHSGTLVHDNTIRLQSRYTNAFAIVGGQEVYNNVIDNGEGLYNSRGIVIGGGSESNPRKVFNNTITVQAIANNQEYFGTILGGAYGIQAEGGGHAEVYGNTVTAFANGSEAYAFRMNESTPGSDIYVHDNVFRGIRNNTQYEAASVRLTDVVFQSLRLENNVLETNNQWLGQSSGVDRIVFKNNTLKAVGNTVGFEALESYNYQGNQSTAIYELEMIDNVFADAASRQLLIDSPVHSGYGGVDNGSSFNHRFNTGFHVIDGGGNSLAGATIKVFNGTGQQIFSGTADLDGRASLLIREFRTQGDTTTSNGPYQVRAELNGETVEVDFNADQKQTIDLQIGIGQGEQYSFNYNGTTLNVIGNGTDDHFEWSASAPLVLRIDGTTFDLQPGITRIQLYGRGGTNSFTGTGSSGDDMLLGLSGRGVLQTPQMIVSFDETATNVVSAGSGGFDMLNLYGTTANEQVVLGDNLSRQIRGNWQLETSGFNDRVANSGGGNDSVTITTAGDSSLFNVSSDRVAVRDSGGGRFANDFSTVNAQTTGIDGRVYAVDSNLNDTLEFGEQSIRLVNSLTSFIGTGFVTQVVRALNGGNDSVSFAATSGSDLFFTNTNIASLSDGGANYWRSTGFDSVSATGSAGDLATIRGSATDSVYVADANGMNLTTSERVLDLTGFGSTRTIFRTTGNSQVSLTGSSGNDLITGDANQLRLTGSTFNHFVKQFDSAVILGGSGTDSFYLNDSVLNDQVTLGSQSLEFVNSNVNIVATGFERQVVTAGAGGNDSVIFNDSVRDDDFFSKSAFTSMQNKAGIYNRAANFNSVELQQLYGADDDSLTLFGSNSADAFVFSGQLASVTSASLSRSFSGMSTVKAYWNSSQDTLVQDPIDYELELIDEA